MRIYPAAFLVLLSTKWVAVPVFGDMVFKAVEDELSRTMNRLQMAGLQKSYFAAYTLRQGRTLFLESDFGGIVDRSAAPYRDIKVELRIGDRSFDSSNFVGPDWWAFVPFTERGPFEDDYDALRFSLWSVTDQAYKQALERYSQKKAYKETKVILEQIPDLSEEKPHILLSPVEQVAVDEEAWKGRVRDLSAVFREYPKIQKSDASFFLREQNTYFLNSEGSRFRKPSHIMEVEIEAQTQAKDGMELGDSRSFLASRLEDLPSQESLAQEAHALARDLSALVDASTMSLYLGPVLFENQAAAEFFNQLLAHNVSYPKSVWVEEERAKRSFESGEFASRFGQRVLSPFLGAEDDPMVSSFQGTPLIGRYEVDDEGVPARKVQVVEKGKLVDILMSRAPVKERRASNGHGRGGFWEFPSGRIGNFFIRSERSVPFPQLKEQLLKLCREVELEHGLIIRRMSTEGKRERDNLLAPPVQVYKVSVRDGSESPVRGLEFTGVSLRALRDVVAASNELYVYNFFKLGPVLRNRGGVKASLIAPSILVQEMELKAIEKKPERLPYLPNPYFAQKKK